MWVDELGEFASNLAIDTAGTGADIFGDVIDLGPNGRDVGAGEPVFFVLQCTQALDSAADTVTITIDVVSDAQAALATDGSATKHLTIGPLAVGDDLATAGGMYAVALPRGQQMERFLGVIVTSGTQAPTAGKFNAFLTHDVPSFYHYPDSPND